MQSRPGKRVGDERGGVSDVILGYAHCGMVAAARWITKLATPIRWIAKLATPVLLKALQNHPDYKLQILAPLPIVFAVFLVHLATIPIAGTGINPARSLGAAIIYKKDHAWDDHGFNAGLFDYLIATYDSEIEEKEQTDGHKQVERKKSET